MPTMRFHRASWAALVVAVPLVLPGGTATAAARSSKGVLTADTVITWTGTAGMVLSTSGTGSLPDEAMTLYVDGGTYAFVTLLVDPQPKACATDLGQPHCWGFTLALFPHAGELSSTPKRGDDHLTFGAQPPSIIGKRLNAYLITDGRATLRLRPTGYRGRSSYVAAGRIRGRAQALPHTCGQPVCGTTAAGSAAGGGATFDFGTKPGHMQAIAYGISAMSADPTTGGNHPVNVQSCVYPSAEHPTASPDPATHPYGCDVVTAESGRALESASDDLNGLRIGAGGTATWVIGDLTGRRYAGFFSSAVWTQPVAHGGYGIWFNYGISS
jgi:hypothetical protein